jgi:hypothetical protein
LRSESSFFGRPLATACPRRGQPSPRPLADQFALELGQRPEDVEDQLPATRRRVDLLRQALEADPRLCQGIEQLDEIRERAAEAIEPPDDERVTGATEVKCFPETRPLSLRPTHRVGEDLLAADCLKRVAL